MARPTAPSEPGPPPNYGFYACRLVTDRQICVLVSDMKSRLLRDVQRTLDTLTDAEDALVQWGYVRANSESDALERVSSPGGWAHLTWPRYESEIP